MPNISSSTRFILYADDANILISGNSITEIEDKFNDLSKKLEIWVNLNRLSINLKKTNYMIFAKHNVPELPFKPTICKYEIERKINARFLGVIINENLAWNNHILGIKAKMSRYVGILYKLKKLIPITARKNIFHSFVQSHLNYCCLVWGLGPKASIEPLFSEQKKAMRALRPGFNSNYFKDGLTPCHTKPFFTEYNILTVHSIIFANVLIFMHKYRYFSKTLPPLVSDIISSDAPKYDHSNLDSEAWMANHLTGRFRHAISFKGPLFYLNYMPKIMERFHNCHENSINMPLKIFKKYAKSFALNIQSCGSLEEWEGQNTPLYYVPGLPREHRKNIPKVIYKTSND